MWIGSIRMSEYRTCEICKTKLNQGGNCPSCTTQSEIEDLIQFYEEDVLGWASEKYYSEAPRGLLDTSSLFCNCALCTGQPESDPIFNMLYEDFEFLSHEEGYEYDDYDLNEGGQEEGDKKVETNQHDEEQFIILGFISGFFSWLFD